MLSGYGSWLWGSLRTPSQRKTDHQIRPEISWWPSFSQLQSTLEEKNVEEAFRAAHTLKGVAQNLGFTPLYEATATLTEVLRAGNLPEDDNMMNAVAKEYKRTVAAIEQLNA